MFSKNSYNPSYAGANGGNANAPKAKDGFTMNAGAQGTDDFAPYNSAPSQQRPAPKRRPEQKKTQNGSNNSSVIIAIAAVLAIILLVIVVVILATSGGGNIKYQDNTYISYSNADGQYFVAANGRVVGTYESEVSLIVSDDNSFAYIIETTEEGDRIYLLEGGAKEPKAITAAPVDKILATASLEPGVVWLEADDGIYYYSEKLGDYERISKTYGNMLTYSSFAFDNPLSGSEYDYIFQISADASTVVYAEIDEERSPNFNCCIYRDSQSVSIGSNVVPVGISNDGSKVYCSGTRDKISYLLYVFDVENNNARDVIDDNFNSFIGTNVDGDEVLYTVANESGISTYIAAFNAKKIGENEIVPVKIGNGVYESVKLDNDIAVYGSFKETYFQSATPLVSTSTYYLDKDLERKSVSRFSGKFSPDGDYFYYTTDENYLMWIDLNNSEYLANPVVKNVIAFEVTQKGNAYWLSDVDRELKFFDRDNDKNYPIQYDVESISMHTYSNTLYFTCDNAPTIYVTEEGSNEKAAKFGSGDITAVPSFDNGAKKKSFAAVWDNDNSEWRIFYTSNGKSFKYISAAHNIYTEPFSVYLAPSNGTEDNGIPG